VPARVGIAIGSLALISEALTVRLTWCHIITWAVVRVSDSSPTPSITTVRQARERSAARRSSPALRAAGGILMEFIQRLREGAPPPVFQRFPSSCCWSISQ